MKLKLSEVVAKYGNVAIDEAKFKEVFGIKIMKGRKPIKGQSYWVNHSTCAVQQEWDDTYYDRGRWNMGNTYDTQEEAEFARDKQIFLTKFERYLRENEDEPVNWKNESQPKYSVELNFRINSKICIAVNNYYMKQGTIYTTNFEALNSYVKDNESDIKKYMFGVV